METTNNVPSVNSGGDARNDGNDSRRTGEVYNSFLEWVVLTTEEKQKIGLPTAKAFAEKYKVHESQLSRWKARDDFNQAQAELQKFKCGLMTADVLHGLYNRCVKYGMASDVELWLAYVERWDKKQILEHRQEIKLGSEDFRTLVDFLPVDEQKHFYNTLTDLIAKAETYRHR